MRSFLRFTILLLLHGTLVAQQRSQLDSLHNVLKNATNDTVRLDAYDQFAYYYIEVNQDSSLAYANKELSLSRKLGLRVFEANALTHIGYMEQSKGNYPQSLQSFLEAIDISEDSTIERGARYFSSTRSPHETRLDVLSTANYLVGLLYSVTGDQEKAILSFRRSEDLAASINDTAGIGFAHWQIGVSYAILGKLDSALHFARRTLNEFSVSAISGRDRRYQGRTYTGGVYNSIGVYFQKEGEFDSARSYMLEGARINLEQNNQSNLGFSYELLGNLYLAMKDPASGLLYGRKCLETYQTIGDRPGQSKAFRLISAAYQTMGKSDSALAFLTKYTVLFDSLNSADRKNILAYQSLGFDEQLRQKKMEEERVRVQARNRTIAMLAGIAALLVIAYLLYRNSRSRQKANTLLHQQKEELQSTLVELKSTQSQLIQSEKMASLGELTAGIAHEIQNPLNFVNNFSDLNKELIAEVDQELEKGDIPEARQILTDLRENEDKISHHGQRADSIVKSMLQHSRTSSGQKEPTDLNALADEYLKLAYHGLRAKDKDFNVTLETDFDLNLGKVDVVPQDIGRVLLNLYNNAFHAVQERMRKGEPGYVPKVKVEIQGSVTAEAHLRSATDGQAQRRGDVQRTSEFRIQNSESVRISVSDNGSGIPDGIRAKIFQPFFTTKPTGQGTGLGLSLSYDIIKAHGGELSLESKEGDGSAFVVQLPIS